MEFYAYRAYEKQGMLFYSDWNVNYTREERNPCFENIREEESGYYELRGELSEELMIAWNGALPPMDDNEDAEDQAGN